MTTFKDRAQIGIDRGIPVIRVAARAKIALDKNWPEVATTDSEVIAKWDAETPAANSAFVARAEIGGVWMLETDSTAPAKAYEEATGKKFTRTFTVQSREGRGHRYYKHNIASIAMGNIGQKEADGFSVRANNAYCLGPLSIHPTGAVYMTKLDGPIVEADSEMIAWLISQKKASAVSSTPCIAGPKIPLGGHDNYLCALALKLRLLGAEEEGIFHVLTEVVEKRCEGYGSDYQQMTRKHARNTCAKFPAGDPTGGVLIGGKSPGQSQVEVNEPETLKLASIEDLEVVGMPESVIPEDSVLGKLFYDKLANLFPIDFGWVSLIHAAGVLVPATPRGTIASSNDDLTNFYTALVGPTNCGKTTAWTHARLALGIREETGNYINLKSGSAESLFENIQKGRRDGAITDQLFIDVDELSHLFKKIGIEGSSFAPVLTTGFYKRMQTMFMGKGKSVTLNCAMSWIGGIVTEEFEECFGSATIGGLYDRFMFGLCPTGYTLAYDDFRGEPANVNPIPVTIDPSVYEVIKSWRKDHPELTREIELAVRFAKVIASFDRRPVLFGKDLEGAPLIFAMEQSRIRKTLKPNAGDNPDARFANAIMSLLARKTKPGEWIDMRQVKQQLNVFRENLGPNVMERAINGLLRAGDIEINTDKTRRNGKTFIRLAVDE
jgi:bifunctional DNA primase/polymerase-like protein